VAKSTRATDSGIGSIRRAARHRPGDFEPETKGNFMTYSFRNRFEAGRPLFTVDVDKYVLIDTPEEGKVVLRAARPNARLTSATTNYAVQGSGYANFDEALNAGRAWRQRLIAAFARDGRAVDFGDDDDEHLAITWQQEVTGSSDLLESVGITVGDVCAQDRIGLLVFESEPTKEFLSWATGTPNVLQNIERFVEGPLKTASERAFMPWDRRQKLAHTLVHSALLDADPRTRYIQLVTAIEAMLPNTQWSDEVLGVLNDLKSMVKGVDGIEDDTRDRVLAILGEKRESIRSRGKKYVSILRKRYGDGMEPFEFFDDCYQKRSALVHGNLSVPDVTQYRPLLDFVLDLLDADHAERTE
jgi:hypothetical protein